MVAEVTYDVHAPVARATDRHPLARAWAVLTTPTALSVAALMTVVGAVYLALSWNHRAPMLYFDEAGMLGNARWMAGGRRWWMGTSSPFQLGYPLLIAPVFALVHSPAAIYRVVMAVNALLCALLAGLLYLLARKLVHAPPNVAIATSLIACAYPAVAVQSGVAWAELPAMVAVALFVLTGWWMLQRPGYPAMLTHATVAAYLFLLHGRFVAVPFVLVAMLGYLAVRHRALRAPAMVSIALTLAGVVAAKLAQGAVRRARWDPGFGNAPTVHKILQGVPVAMIRQLSGNVFYLLVATMGLAAIGVVALWSAFVDGRGLDLTASSPRRVERWVGSIYILGALATVVLVSSAEMGAGNPPRFNFSGRYSEPLNPTLLALGLATLLVRRRRRVVIVRSLWIAAGLILVLGSVVAVINGTRGGIDLVRWVTSPGVRPFFAGGTSFGADSANQLHSDLGIPLLTITGTVLAVSLALAARRLRWSIAVFALCMFVLVSAVDVRFMSKSATHATRGTATYAAMRARHPQTVAYDLDTFDEWSFYGLPFWLSDSTFVAYRSSQQAWPRADMYIGAGNWPEAARRGLHLLTVDPLSNRGVWVR